MVTIYGKRKVKQYYAFGFVIVLKRVTMATRAGKKKIHVATATTKTETEIEIKKPNENKSG